MSAVIGAGGRASRRAAASWPKRHHRAGWRQELSGTIAQCLKLEHEIHDTASKLCILGFEPLK